MVFKEFLYAYSKGKSFCNALNDEGMMLYSSMNSGEPNFRRSNAESVYTFESRDKRHIKEYIRRAFPNHSLKLYKEFELEENMLKLLLSNEQDTRKIGFEMLQLKLKDVMILEQVEFVLQLVNYLHL